MYSVLFCKKYIKKRWIFNICDAILLRHNFKLYIALSAPDDYNLSVVKIALQFIGPGVYMA